MRRIKILSLLFGIVFSLSFLNAQQSIDVPVPSKDSTEQTVKVIFEPARTNVNFKNTAEALTQEQINQIVTILEESNNASTESANALRETLMTLQTLLKEGAFLQNKVIYQAKRHYNLSESEVKRSLRKDQWLQLGAYILILVVFASAARRTKKKEVFHNGFIELDKLAIISILFFLEAFVIWYILLPATSIVLNNDFEIIKFLLQGA